MSLEIQPFYEFGPYRLEPSERLLLRSGEPVALPPKAFETLLLLVQNSGHAVSRGELMKTLWPGTFVEENNLTQHISLLRKALGGNSGEQEYIETVPRLGYRFVVPVRAGPGGDGTELLLHRHTRTHITLEEQEEEISESEADSNAADPPSPRLWRAGTPTAEARLLKQIPRTKTGLGMTTSSVFRRSVGRLAAARTWLVLGVVAAAAALTAVYFVGLRSGTLSSRPAQPRTLAVLPFRDLKPDAQSEFLSYSLADAINHRLGYISAIVVRPSSYVAKYRGGDADPRVVAQELHVEAVLTGNYIREGDRLRVSAELVDVAKAEVLWRDTFDLPYDQLLTVQDRVAESVARGLQLRILPQQAERLKKSVPQNPLAYEYYLRAQGSDLSNDYRNSIQMLEKSIALDPNYAPAWMTLGNAYAGYANWQGGGTAYLEKSQAAYAKALELEPELPLIHTFMAIQMMEGGDLDGGLVALREELRLNPNEASAHWWLSEAYLYGGMLPESIAEGEQALRLDPLVNIGSTFNSYLHAGDYKKFLSALPMGEGARTTFYRGLCFLYMKQSGRAAAEFARAYREDPTLLHAKYGRAFLYALERQPAEGLRYLEEVEVENPTGDGEMLYKMGQAYTLLGDRSSAFRLLREAIDHNFYCYACFVRDPLLAPLRGEPQYSELMSLAREGHESFKRKYF
jgi:DNA-binding winged helix-turn-helix (wHTH) protein/TolB-like protein/Tfp pilus assembly protein PilF